MRNEKTVISTKTLDLNAISYQDASKLRARLNSYTKSLDDFSSELENKNEIIRGGKAVSQSECEKIVLEIIIPDTVISEDVYSVLNDFQRRTNYEIWFRIGY